MKPVTTTFARAPFKRQDSTGILRVQAADRTATARKEVKIGDKFTNWTVVGMAVKRMAVCQCECGLIKEVFKSHLTAGNSTGCRNCRSTEKYKTHDMYRTSTYTSWKCMKDRCLSESHIDFHRYGGKGIKICDKWLSFAGFFEDMGERPNGHTLDRKINSDGYHKDNCRWATPKQQANNSSWNEHINYKGKNFTYAELAELLGLKYATLYARIKRGQPLDAPLQNEVIK